MTFNQPWVLVLTVLALVGFVPLVRSIERRRSATVLAYSNLDFFERAVGSRVPWSALVLAAWTLALACFGIALAGPKLTLPILATDSAVVLCIDTSGSMSASDVVPTRIEAAMAAANAFVNALPNGTRIGIVAFATSAALIIPVTDDKDAVRDALGHLPAPNGGTAIGDALALAERSLPPVAHRSIVLVTDGVNNAGSDPRLIAKQVGAADVKISTVGIGTNGSGIIIPGTDQAAELDEPTLRAIAEAGKGEYARATDAGELRDHLADLAHEAVIETRRVDASFPIAVVAGAIMFVATLGALTLGRYP